MIYEIGFVPVNSSTVPVPVTITADDVNLEYGDPKQGSTEEFGVPHAYNFTNTDGKSVGWAPFDLVLYIRQTGA